MKLTRVLLILTASAWLSACAPGQAAKDIANSAVGNIGCKVSQSEMWNSLHKIAEANGVYPSGTELRAALLDAGASKGLSGASFEKYVDAFVAHYENTISGIKAKLDPHDVASWKKALAEMEVGVRVTEVHEELLNSIQSTQSKLDLAEKETGASCPKDSGDEGGTVGTLPPPLPSGTIWEQLKKTENPEVYGARKTLATAYQSCEVLALPPMDASTPTLAGIEILPDRHPAGGLKRVIGDLAKVDETHYYIKYPHRAKPSCFDVKKNPLIYDFGGKPFTSAGNTKKLDLFKNAGSGTNVLGIDCSAYVFSSLAVAGLKMDPDKKKPLKADLVHGIGSRAFKEPQSNGLRCLDKIAAGKSIEAGDIAAINGHVVMIDQVSPDPFGLRHITRVEDCTADNLSYKKFEFVIAQSSPSKGGIGINRFQAKDYLLDSSTYRTGLTNYAIAACKAKFGKSATVDTTNLAVVRHKRTPDCLAEEPLEIEKEDCVDSCQAF